MKKATKYALINSAIAGGLVFLGAFASGQITVVGVVSALSASLIVFLTKIKDYFGKVTNKKGAITPGVFTFYGA
ncbi:MAG: hypothetical protein HC874_27320 [Richelia sp. SL_2_1]|nr:hypothetical protein [Richelia sp. SL_2_1]